MTFKTGEGVSATNPMPVEIISGGGGGASGTEYVEDAVLPGDPSGAAIILRRKDVPVSGLVSAEGDAVAAQADAAGKMHVRALELETVLATLAGYLDGVETLLSTVNDSLNTTVSALPRTPILSASDMVRVQVNVSTATDTVLLAAGGAGVTHRVHRLVLSISGACTITFKTAAATLLALDIPAGGGIFTLDFCERPWLTTVANEALNLTTSAAVNVKGFISTVTG